VSCDRKATVAASLVELGDAFEAAIKPTTTRRKDPLPPAPNDALMTRAEVAALLRTTPAQVSNMLARGQLCSPAKIAGLGLRWRRADVVTWLEQAAK
jgi:predicted DNA-binding transcriptional regulator AlpA